MPCGGVPGEVTEVGVWRWLSNSETDAVSDMIRDDDLSAVVSPKVSERDRDSSKDSA